jgi:hypothetical protein
MPRATFGHGLALAPVKLGGVTAELPVLVDVRGLVMYVVRIDAVVVVAEVRAVHPFVRPGPQKVIQLDAGARVLVEPRDRTGQASLVVLELI